MAKYDVEQINKAVAGAIAAGREFVNEDDGGTCNFDACMIYVPGMRKTTAENIPNAFMMDTRWHDRHLQLRGTEGQGMRRTKMAEAQKKFLEANYPDLKVGMYYQMD